MIAVSQAKIVCTQRTRYPRISVRIGGYHIDARLPICLPASMLVNRTQPLDLDLRMISSQRHQLMSNGIVLPPFFLIDRTDPNLDDPDQVRLHLARPPEVVQCLIVVTCKRQSRSDLPVRVKRKRVQLQTPPHVGYRVLGAAGHVK